MYFFTLSDILTLDLQSEIVFLSACDTGASRSKYSPPFSGLASAFIAAGSEKVVVSLWPIEDKATRLLMELFVKMRGKNDDWLTAKRSAINEFRKIYPEYTAPYFWSAFPIFGVEFQ